MTPMIQNVCAKAPPGVDSYADMLIGWAKYGVLALIVPPLAPIWAFREGWRRSGIAWIAAVVVYVAARMAAER